MNKREFIKQNAILLIATWGTRALAVDNAIPENGSKRSARMSACASLNWTPSGMKSNDPSEKVILMRIGLRATSWASWCVVSRRAPSQLPKHW
jgi:hypothetical protein